MFEQLTIVGNLGRDPGLRYTSGGASVTTFPVTVNRKWTNQDGTPGEETT
jgi:single-strand DNA-binding protein